MIRRNFIGAALAILFLNSAVIAESPAPVTPVVPVTDPPPKKDKEKPHRGRIQAQGGGLEDSEAWAQDEAPTKKDLLEKLDKLWGRLTKKQKEERQKGYDEAKKWIEGLPEGGVDAPVSKSFPKQNDGNKRIDIEIIKGKAGTGKK